MNRGDWAEVGARLKRACAEAGLSLQALGTRMGVSRPTIYAYAAGTLRMSPRRLAQAAEILSKPVSYFDPRDLDDLDEHSVAKRTVGLVEAWLSPPDSDRASQIALQALESREAQRSSPIRAELLRQAGNTLASKGDYMEATRLLEEARALFRAAGRTESEGACAQTLGVCAISLGQLSTAEACFKSAQAMLSEADAWKAHVALAALAERTGGFDEAESRLSAMLDDTTLSDTAMAYIRANHASLCATRGHWRSAETMADLALDSAFASDLTDQVAEMFIVKSFAASFLARPEEALGLADRASDVAFGRSDSGRANLARFARAFAFLKLGRLAEAKEENVAGHAHAVQTGQVRTEAVAHILMAEAAFAAEDWAAARDAAVLGKSQAAARRYPVAEVIAGAWHVRALVRLGQARSAALEAAHCVSESRRMGLGAPLALSLIAWLETGPDDAAQVVPEIEQIQHRHGPVGAWSLVGVAS